MEGLKNLAPEQMLKVLQMESTFLDKLHGKIAEELHRLQVEEDVFVRSLSRMKTAQKAEQEELDRELQHAMSTELQDDDTPPAPEKVPEVAPEANTPRTNPDRATTQFALTGDLPEGHEIVPIGP